VAIDTGTPRNQGDSSSADARRMTVGQLSRRSGMSVRAIRAFEAAGLIYSAGRTVANYRLYDDSALWCIGVIRTLRDLGLTIREIEGLAAMHDEHPAEPIGTPLARLLDLAERRIERRIADLDTVAARIAAFRTEHADALAGGADEELLGQDPRRRPIA